MTKTNEYTQDPSVNDVIDSIIDRSNRGMSHYGVSIRDNAALTIRQWLEHAREEMTDAAVYLTKIMEEMELLEHHMGILLSYISRNDPDYYNRIIQTMPAKYKDL